MQRMKVAKNTSLNTSVTQELDSGVDGEIVCGFGFLSWPGFENLLFYIVRSFPSCAHAPHPAREGCVRIRFNGDSDNTER
jgi:hypothetical protein